MEYRRLGLSGLMVSPIRLGSAPISHRNANRSLAFSVAALNG